MKNNYYITIKIINEWMELDEIRQKFWISNERNVAISLE